MYRYTKLDELFTGSEDAVNKPIIRYGIGVYVDSDPDLVDPDFHIDPLDTEGIKIFREFAARMAVHYKTLKDKS